jgi:hypothetical protein
LNQRRNERVPCGAPAGAAGVTGICRNISQGGMFFLGATLPVGQPFEFWVQLPNGKLVVTGEVHYAHQYPEGAGIGVHFTAVPPEASALLTEFLASAPEPVRTTRRSD